ncbi:MAG: chain length determinant protein EpsF [Burkholderiales bacterium]|nr:chain length determinant protein EpsF [Burkholderiales bacterium]
MTIGEILTAFRARWRIAVLVWAFVVATVLSVSLIRTPEYTSTAAVLLDVKSPDPIAGIVLPGMTVVGYMATQLHVIQSERVALGAIQILGLENNPEYRAKWQQKTNGVGDFKSWLAEHLTRYLSVVPAKDSNVLTLSYTSPDPEFAAKVANAWVKSYVDTTLGLRTEPAKQYYGFFDARGKQLRSELEAAQSRLSAYQQSKGIVANDERLDVENMRLAELSSQLVVLQGISNESGGRQSQSAANADRMSEVLNNPVIISMSNELSTAEARLKELGARLGDNHPDIVEARARVGQLRSAIAAETKRVASSLTVNNDINQIRLAQLRAALEAQRSKLLHIKTERDESAVLQRDVENAQRAYDAMELRASQTSLESQTTQTNVSVLKLAAVSPLPSSPRIVLNIAVAILVGGLLAVAAALLSELRDRRLRTDLDVLRTLGQPLIGVLPAKAIPKRPGPARYRLTTNAGGSSAS